MSANRERLVPWQKHRSGPEAIPLRERSPSISVLHEPSDTGSIVSEEEEGSQDDGTPNRATQDQLQGLTRGVVLSKKQRLLDAGVAGELKKNNLALILVLVYVFVAILS